MTFIIRQHELTAQWAEDENGRAVLLTQSHSQDGSYVEPQTVFLHPWQLREVCEQLGAAPANDANVYKTMTRMARRICVLSEKISEFQKYMVEFSDHEHADLSKELTKLDALALLAGEWAADAVDSGMTEQTPQTALEAVQTPHPRAGAGNAAAAHPEQLEL